MARVLAEGPGGGVNILGVAGLLAIAALVWLCVKRKWYKQLVGGLLFVAGSVLMIVCLYPVLTGEEGAEHGGRWRHVWAGVGAAVALSGVVVMLWRRRRQPATE